LGEGAVEVGSLVTCFGGPSELLSVGKDTSSECGTIVTAKTNKHHSEFGNSNVCSDCLLLDDGSGCVFSGIEKGKSALVVNFNVGLTDLLLDTGNSGYWLVGGECEFTFRGGFNDWGSFH
jgi:hypothetical protein